MNSGAVGKEDLLPDVAALDIEAVMREAMQEAEQAGLAGELPIGAVLIIDGAIVARGRARHRELHSQLMHAEMQVLLGAGALLWERHESAVLFTTLEPCPMCLGATVMADIPHIVFGSHDKLVDSRLIVETVPYVRRHIRTYLGGILEGEAREQISRFDPKLLRYITTGNG